MVNPSISMPESMEEEIEKRREKGVNRSEYIRQAIQARFEAEDAGTWDVETDDDAAAKQPAET